MAEKKKVKKKKKRISLAAMGVVLVASGVASIQQGDQKAGLVLIGLGLVVIVMATYVEK